ncbi:hypothetical protein [Streptomyces sp. SID5473]|nr:hypothetical protein [Streptomyces sp. SID5473]
MTVMKRAAFQVRVAVQRGRRAQRRSPRAVRFFGRRGSGAS